MITTESITKLVGQLIEGTDIFLVEVTVKPGNTILVYVDRPEGIPIEQCVKISRYLNDQLDRDEEDFSLEISSPGLGAAFKVKQQYDKNTDREIEVLLQDGVKIKGKLLSVTEEGIVLKVKENSKEFNFKQIKTSKAIISFN